jgi:hypothetical protein
MGILRQSYVNWAVGVTGLDTTQKHDRRGTGRWFVTGWLSLYDQYERANEKGQACESEGREANNG